MSLEERIKSCNSVNELRTLATSATTQGNFQLARYALVKAWELNPNDVSTLKDLFNNSKSCDDQTTAFKAAMNILRYSEDLEIEQYILKQTKHSLGVLTTALDLVIENNIEGCLEAIVESTHSQPVFLPNYVLLAGMRGLTKNPQLRERINQVLCDPIVDSLHNSINLHLVASFTETFGRLLDFETYEKIIRAGLNYDSSNERLWFLYGKLLTRAGHYSRAEKALEHVKDTSVNLHTSDSAVHNNLLQLLGSRVFEKEQYSVHPTSLIETHIYRPACAIALGKTDQFVEEIQRMELSTSQLSPEARENYYTCLTIQTAAASYWKGDYMAALHIFEDIERLPKSVSDFQTMRLVNLNSTIRLNKFDPSRMAEIFTSINEEILKISNLSEHLQHTSKLNQLASLSNYLDVINILATLFFPKEIIRKCQERENDSITSFKGDEEELAKQISRDLDNSFINITATDLPQFKTLPYIGILTSQLMAKYLTTIGEGRNLRQDKKDSLFKELRTLDSPAGITLELSQYTPDKLSISANYREKTAKLCLSRITPLSSRVHKFLRTVELDNGETHPWKTATDRLEELLFVNLPRRSERKIVKIYDADSAETEKRMVQAAREMNIRTPLLSQGYTVESVGINEFEEIEGPGLDLMLEELRTSPQLHQIVIALLEQHITDTVNIGKLDRKKRGVTARTSDYLKKLKEVLPDTSNSTLQYIGENLQRNSVVYFRDASPFNAKIDAIGIKEHTGHELHQILNAAENGQISPEEVARLMCDNLMQLDLEKTNWMTFPSDDLISTLEQPYIQLTPEDKERLEKSYISLLPEETQSAFHDSRLLGGFYRHLRFWHHYKTGELKGDDATIQYHKGVAKDTLTAAIRVHPCLESLIPSIDAQ